MAYPQLVRRRKTWGELLPGGEPVNEALLRLVRNPPPLDEPLTKPRLVQPPEPEVAGQYTPQQLYRRPQLVSAKSVINTDVPLRRVPPPPVDIEEVLPPMPRPAVEFPAPAPPMVEAGMRPERRSTGDSLADEIDYRDQLERYKPANHNSTGAGIGLGALRGLQRGGLLGALIGAVRGGVDKSADEKDARLEAIPRSDANISRQLGVRRVMSDLEDEKSMRALRDAQTQKLLRPPVVKPVYRMNGQGQVIKITPNQTEGEPDNVEVIDRSTRAYAPNVREIDGRLMVYNRQTQRFDPALDRNGNEITSELNSPVDFEIDGKTYRVKPATAAMARATGQKFDISQAATESRFQRGEARQDARSEVADARRTQTEERQARTQAEVLINRARTLRTQASKAKSQEEYDNLINQAELTEGDVRSQFPDLVEDVEVPTGVGFFGGLAGQPRRATTVRLKTRSTQGQTAAPTRSLPKLSEQQIRDAAKAKGLNPDEAVKRARSRGQL